MTIERKKVTKRQDLHPAETLTTGSEDDRVAADRAPEPRPTSTTRAGEATKQAEEEPKVPSSFRLPRSLLNRLETGSVVIPAALGHRVSKNQIVENAIDAYLSSYNL